jgi:fucose permease
MGVIVLLPAIPAIIAVYPKSQASFVFSQAGGLLVEPTIWVAAIMLFCYISLETSLCNWLPSFGKEVIVGATPGVDVKKADTSAQRLLSRFAVGMIAGRLVASQISGITTYGSWFIAGAALASAIIILLMMKTKSILESRILAILAGLTFAPCFPTIVGITFVKYHPEIYGSIFGIIFAIGLLGAVIVPKTIGNLSKRSSVQKCLKLLLPACLVLIVLALVMGGLKAVKS